MRLTIALVTGLIAAWSAMSASLPAADASAVRLCGSFIGEGALPYSIRATNVSCGRARRVVERVSKVSDAPFRGCVTSGKTRVYFKTCVRDGFRCFQTNSGAYTLFVTCRREAATIRFKI